MKTVNDYIKNNDSDIEIIIRGVNPVDDCDPLVSDYYKGTIGAVPSYLRKQEVLYTSWSLGFHMHCLCIAMLSANVGDDI